MGHKKDAQVDAAFIEFKAQPDDKCFSIRCRYCNWTRAKNTLRQRQHLQDCGAYQLATSITSSLSAISGITARAARERPVSDEPLHYTPITTDEERRSLDYKAAMAIYANKLPFEYFEEPEMAEMLQILKP